MTPDRVSPIRVGLVGARRARQGLGPFVARDLSAAGAEVPCFLVTKPENVAGAAAQLARVAGVAPRGYTDLGAMLAAEELDALAICTPHETHLECLEAALEAGIHVLCEKPLVWGVDDLPGTAARLSAAFVARGLVLRENCPWSYSLPALRDLYPGALAGPPRRFGMRLQPAGRGLRMLPDALPHPLSLLQALAPGPGASAEEIRFAPADPEAEALVVEFVHRSGGVAIEARVQLDRSDAHPRHVWLEIDGHRADRLVSADYRLSLSGDGRTVPLEDPLTRLVGDFVRDVGSPGQHELAPGEIAERMKLLAEIADAWHQAMA